MLDELANLSKVPLSQWPLQRKSSDSEWMNEWMSQALATKCTLIYMHAASWNLLATQTHFTDMMTLYLQAVDKKIKTVPTALHRIKTLVLKW